MKRWFAASMCSRQSQRQTLLSPASALRRGGHDSPSAEPRGTCWHASGTPVVHVCPLSRLAAARVPSLHRARLSLAILAAPIAMRRALTAEGRTLMRSLGPGAPGLGSLPAAAVAGTEAAAAAPSAAMRHSFTSQVWVWA